MYTLDYLVPILSNMNLLYLVIHLVPNVIHMLTYIFITVANYLCQKRAIVKAP